MFNIGDFEDKKKFDLNVLTRHAVVLGATGSGKTVLCKSIIEEAVLNHIPIIAIDPKGDISSLGIASGKFDFRPYSDIEARSAQSSPDEFSKTLREKYEKNLEASGVKKTDISKYCETIDLNIFTPKSSSGLTLSVAPNLTAPKNFKEMHDEDATISSKLIEPIAESLLLLIDYPQDSKKETALITRIIEESWLNSRTISVTELIGDVSNPKFERIGAMEVESFISKKQRERLASKLNLLISTPSLKYWFNGDNIDFGKLLSGKGKTRVNVIDLRFISDEKEKEFFMDRILGELYNWLIKQQGTQNLRYILYIDEIKSFVPPYPNNPPSKKILDLLVRQGRAFGLGCLLATQNPGDIDYKMLGNMNTRFIGKLRTERDIEKIASGIDVPAKEITKRINLLNEREFLYNKQDSNEFIRLKPRWLISYHRGPLSEEEIRTLSSARKHDGLKGDSQEDEEDEKRFHGTNEIESDQGTFAAKLKRTSHDIIGAIRKSRDVKIIIESEKTRYTPILHCRISVSDEKNKINAQIYLDCDLTKKIVEPVQMNLDESSIHHAKIQKDERLEIFLDRNLTESQLFTRLKKSIKTKFFVSKEFSFYSNNRREVIDKNRRFLEKGFEDTISSIEKKHNPDITKRQERSKEIARKITNLEFEMEMKKSQRENYSEKEIREMTELKSDLDRMKKETEKMIRTRDDEIRKEHEAMKKRIENIEEIDLGPQSPGFRMESRIIWIPEQEINVKIKTRTSEHEIRMSHNHKGIISLGKCSRCNKDIKDTDDIDICAHCGKIFCSRHIETDGTSGKKYCAEHFTRCAICFRKFGLDSMRECPSCKKTVCIEDMIQCPSCGKIVCKRCINNEGILNIFRLVPKDCKLCHDKHESVSTMGRHRQ